MTEGAPFGSWARVYALVIGAALAVMLLLFWLTRAWNIPLDPR